MFSPLLPMLLLTHIDSFNNFFHLINQSAVLHRKLCISVIKSNNKYISFFAVAAWKVHEHHLNMHTSLLRFLLLLRCCCFFLFVYARFLTMRSHLHELLIYYFLHIQDFTTYISHFLSIFISADVCQVCSKRLIDQKEKQKHLDKKTSNVYCANKFVCVWLASSHCFA